MTGSTSSSVSPSRAEPTGARSRGETSARGLLLTLAALLALAALSFSLRFAPLGVWSYPVALGIASIKALLVALFFMEIRAEKPTAIFAITAGLVMVALLIVFLVGDVVTRTVPPLADPPGTSPRALG